MTRWDGSAYQRRFDALAASGVDVDGEATFVRRLGPESVLDAGCGTGRVAIELARHGIDVVGVDLDESMLDVARRAAPGLRWVAADLASVDLGRAFDVVVLAGNVLLFTAPGTQPGVVASCARHAGRFVVAGFQLDGGYDLRRYDDDCAAAGLELEERWATWDGEPFTGGDYAVSLHRVSSSG